MGILRKITSYKACRTNFDVVVIGNVKLGDHLRGLKDCILRIVKRLTLVVKFFIKMLIYVIYIHILKNDIALMRKIAYNSE